MADGGTAVILPTYEQLEKNLKNSATARQKYNAPPLVSVFDYQNAVDYKNDMFDDDTFEE